MDDLVVAVAQPACAAGDVEANVLAHAAAVADARARLVVFPELSLTGYELAAPAFDLDALDPLRTACGETGCVALVGAPIRELGGDFIAMLAVGGDHVTVAYRKMWLGGAEPKRFTPGTEPTVLEVDGWRVGLGICKDTGVAEHVGAMAAMDLDLYAAGVVHLPEDLEEQERRARRIAGATGAYVALASFAGATGGEYSSTAGCSGIWSPDGAELAKADAEPGRIARATLRASVRRRPPASPRGS